jgi:glycerol kinase
MLLRSSSAIIGRGRRHLSLLAAIDQGTSSSRVILYDAASLKPVASHQMELQSATTNPQAGWSQMDPQAIVSTVATSAEGALQKAGDKATDVIGVGITNQRESTVVWDKTTGKPLYDAILWHDARTAETAKSLEAGLGGQDALRSACGLPISTYFSGVKLRWLLDNVPEVKAAFDSGKALFGTVDTWLAWNLTGGAGKGGRHITDVTNASRTMLMDLGSCAWDSELISKLGVGAAQGALPEITSCAEGLGTICDGGPLDGAPLTAMVGDQQSAMIGQRCFGRGQAKITYGTGAFMLVNAGATATTSNHGLLSTVLYKFGAGAPTQYALEGAVASCAVGINWFKDSLGMLATAPEISSLAAEVPDGTEGLVFVSAFGGLLAPHWRDDARATLVGLTLAHDKRHVARAVLEGIAHQARDVVQCMEGDTGSKVASLRVDGGVSLSNELLQYQADLCNVSVERPTDVETTAMGAAISAGLGAGVWKDVSELPSSDDDIDRKFDPAISTAERQARCGRWQKAVDASFGWAA